MGEILVLAGPNGGGKSSVAGRALGEGVDFFNPDDEARRLRRSDPAISEQDANSWVWLAMKRLLRRAIDEHADFRFESTLGGNSITALLSEAPSWGAHVHVLFVALTDAEMHIRRVAARHSRGGHTIADELIRARYESSRQHLLQLLPALTRVEVYDNSEEADPDEGGEPRPQLIMKCENRRVVECCEPSEVPAWARPVYFRGLGLEEQG